MVAPIVFFAMGILLIQQLPELPGLEWRVASVVALGLCVWLRHWRCSLFWVGLIWASVFAEVGLNDRLSPDLESKIISVSGCVKGLPVRTEQRVRFDFVVSPAMNGVPSKLRLNWYYPDQTVKAGQQWSLTVKLKRPHSNLNPGGFDHERWLFSEGVGAIGYVRNKPAPVLLAENTGWLDVSVWRQALADEIDRVLAKNPNRGVIKALTIGERHSLTPQQWEIFRRTGTVHLMAISGLHIGLIAGLVYFLTSRLWAWVGGLALSPQKVAVAGSLLASLLYAAMAGFSVPTQRALIMLTVVMLAIVWQRNARPVNTLAIALCAVLLLDPLALLSAGFWLSFAAVSAIAYSVSGHLAPENRWRTAIKLHWLTALALSPLLLFFFQQVSVVAPLANLVAVPVVSLSVVPMALLALTLLWIAPWPAECLLVLADIILQALSRFLAALADWPVASLNLGQPSLLAIGFAIFGLLVVLAPRGIPARWLGWVMFFPLLFVETKTPEPGDVTVTLLDVGQGLSAVVRTTHHTLVFDAGARFDSGFDLGASVVAPFLRHQGVGKIDAMVISHGDNDHIGGAASVLGAFAVDRIYSSVPEQLSPYSAGPCEAGQGWVWDRVRFSMLAPNERQMATENDNSCVLKVESESGTLSLTGDIERQAESWLVQTYGRQLKSDVLVVPHHGSKTSSTLPFLKTVEPVLALIPAGHKNRFGFPHQEVLRRYSKQHIAWMNTADHGAITVHLRKGGMKVISQRLEHGRYWNMRPK